MGEPWKKEGKSKHEEEKGGRGHRKQRGKKQGGPLPDPVFPHSIYHLLAYHIIYSSCSSLFPPKRTEALAGQGLSILCLDVGKACAQNRAWYTVGTQSVSVE